MFKTFTYICLIIAGLLLILGVVGWLMPAGYLIISPQTCINLGQLFLLAGINFAILKFLEHKEAAK
jgi:hypothetical protein